MFFSRSQHMITQCKQIYFCLDNAKPIFLLNQKLIPVNILHQFMNLIFITFVMLKPRERDIWLGANDLNTEGVFVWESTGSELSYTNWSFGVVHVIKHFSLPLSPWQTKQKCFFLASL
jgi:hypothetical protein